MSKLSFFSFQVNYACGVRKQESEATDERFNVTLVLGWELFVEQHVLQ